MLILFTPFSTMQWLVDPTSGTEHRACLIVILFFKVVLRGKGLLHTACEHLFEPSSQLKSHPAVHFPEIGNRLSRIRLQVEISISAELRRHRDFFDSLSFLNIPDRLPPGAVSLYGECVFGCSGIGNLGALVVSNSRMGVVAAVCHESKKSRIIVHDEALGNTTPVAEVAGEIDIWNGIENIACDPRIEGGAAAVSLYNYLDLKLPGNLCDT